MWIWFLLLLLLRNCIWFITSIWVPCCWDSSAIVVLVGMAPSSNGSIGLGVVGVAVGEVVVGVGVGMTPSSNGSIGLGVVGVALGEVVVGVGVTVTAADTDNYNSTLGGRLPPPLNQ